ncbi:MAG TPA: ATP-dependent DNA helicase RecG [Bacteroidia bacterium]|jgi:ATP-dependent DNA helicase RecG
MPSLLDTPIEYLKGVGPQRGESLKKELQVFTFGDLLTFFPFRYVDRTKFHKIKEVNAEMPYVQLRGKLKRVELVGQQRAKRLVADIMDDSGTMELVWFQGIKWLQQKLKAGQEYIVFGKITDYNGRLNMAHPEIEEVSDENTRLASAMQPVYNSTEKLKIKGLDSKGISRLLKTLVPLIPKKITETLSQELISKYKLLSREEALRNIHLPQTPGLLARAEFRLKFEELFYIQLKLLKLKLIRQETFKGFSFPRVGEFFNDFYNKHLPFPLTNAQKKVLKEIRADIGSGKQMNRLLQGDVGSGKTVVALMTMLLAIDNNFQACIMAPTEILATQHYNSISELLQNMNVNVALLTGSSKSAYRKKLHEKLRNGEIHILIGTHALLEDEVQFKNLGLTIIDEQHRFGVAQRAKLWKKNSAGVPHILVMTATPIPRTLAMTLYGDLDISVIDEMPPGRKPIATHHRYDSQRMRVFGFMKEQIKLGRQIYVVYPLIEESKKLDLKNLMDGYESIARAFPMPEFQVSIVHGQMKPEAKDYEMQRFLKGQTHIMVATTVIEVGVNVPNASVMVIENAERFGLSQLHQLRGRVGRGADQSYCILMTSYKLSAEAKVRIETMCQTNDGFKIAEVDLELRGPGDMSGTQQSGVVDLKLADLSRDQQILQTARACAIEILNADPNLSQEENKILLNRLNELNEGKVNWSRIS